MSESRCSELSSEPYKPAVYFAAHDVNAELDAAALTVARLAAENERLRAELAEALWRLEGLSK